MEKNTFEIISGGTSLIKGYGYGSNPVVVTDVEGWLDATKEVNTAPKMIGEGSYIIGERVGEITITATFSIALELSEARTIWTRLLNNCLTKGSSVTMIDSKDNGGTVSTEKLVGSITSVKPIPGAWHTTIAVTVLCTNPRKTYS